MKEPKRAVAKSSTAAAPCLRTAAILAVVATVVMGTDVRMPTMGPLP